MDGGATETFISTHVYEKIPSDIRPVLQPGIMGCAELAGPEGTKMASGPSRRNSVVQM